MNISITKVLLCKLRSNESVEDVTKHADLGKLMKFVFCREIPWLHITNARTFEDVVKAKELEIGELCCFEVHYNFMGTSFQVRLIKPYEMIIKFRPDLFSQLPNGFLKWDSDSMLTLWFKSAGEGDTETLKVLWKSFSNCVSIDVKDESFRTALMIACLYGHQESASFLLDQKADLNNVTNNAEDNAFMFSMMRDSPENVNLTRWLLSQKEADVQRRNYEFGTLIHHAVFWGNLPVVQLLLMEGVDFNTKDVNGNDAIAALDVSLDFAASWMSPEQQWNREKALECAKWLRENASSFMEQQSILKQGRNLQNKIVSIAEKNFKLMLSYDWSHQNKILEIRNELVSHGFDVWLDLNEMTGSILASMANGVETCDVFIMAISSKYQCSDNCRLEAEYATRQKKKIVPLLMEPFQPMGWLGLILGSKLYIPFYGATMEMKQIQLLEQQIWKQLENTQVQVPERKTEISPSTSQTPITKAEVFDTWTASEVSQWLVKNGLGEISKTLQKKNFDGKCLREFSMLYASNSVLLPYFIEKMKIDIAAVLRFGLLLRTLE